MIHGYGRVVTRDLAADLALEAPTTDGELEALWLAGEMDGLTLVWREGMAEYVPVSQVENALDLPVRMSPCAHGCRPLRQVASLREHFQALDGGDEEEDEAELGEADAEQGIEGVSAGDSGGAGGQSGSGMTGRQLWELQVFSVFPFRDIFELGSVLPSLFHRLHILVPFMRSRFSHFLGICSPF